MKLFAVQRLAAAIACVGMMAPPAVAGAPISSASDVALREGGLFVGKVVNAQGAPIAKSAVSVRQAGEEVVATETDENGVFAAKGLRGGLYQVVAANGVVQYRLWADQTAPPAANQSALIVSGDAVLSGQYGYQPGGSGFLGWVREHPLLVAAGVATAIAVPLAVADDDDPAS